MVFQVLNGWSNGWGVCLFVATTQSLVVINYSLLSFKPFILCVYFVAEEISLGMNMEQNQRFINVWRSYCLANIKENELIAISKVGTPLLCFETGFENGNFIQGSSGERWNENVIRID